VGVFSWGGRWAFPRGVNSLRAPIVVKAQEDRSSQLHGKPFTKCPGKVRAVLCVFAFSPGTVPRWTDWHKNQHARWRSHPPYLLVLPAQPGTLSRNDNHQLGFADEPAHQLTPLFSIQIHSRRAHLRKSLVGPTNRDERAKPGQTRIQLPLD